MQKLKPGTMVLILNARGPRAWLFEGWKAQIISATNTKVVVQVYGPFNRRETIELALENVIALDQIEPVTTGPFHTGDTVFIHKAAYNQAKDRGQIGRIISAFPAWQKCLVKLDDGAEEIGKLYNFYEVSLMMPERRSPDEDYLRALTQAIQRGGYWRRYNEWWQQQAEKKLWPIDELLGLYKESQKIKAQVEIEIANEIARQQDSLKQAFSGLNHAQKVEKWQAEWFKWIAPYSSSGERHAKERLAEAILQVDDSDEGHPEPENRPETPDEHDQDYHHRNSGPELLERCEKYVKRLNQPKGYAYDAVPFRGITNGAVIALPISHAYRPTLPQTAPQPAEPMALPGREQALTLLRDEGEHFTAALASMATDAGDTSVALLLEKYASLQAREGFDSIRYHRIKNLELALLATQRILAIDAVLKSLPVIHMHSTEFSVQGIMFKGSAQPLIWDEENPWHIRPDEDVQSAIARIWAPVTHYAPGFVALLDEYTLGLALFKQEETGEFFLGYLYLVPLESWELDKYGIECRVPTHTSINQLLEWLDQGYLCLLLGYPPRDPDDDCLGHLPNFHLPLALRKLYAIHSGLYGSFSHEIGSPRWVNRFLEWIGEENKYLLDRFHARNLALLPDQFIEFAYSDDADCFVFDLDCLDERFDPQVARWDHESWEVGERHPFWRWFADFAPVLLLGIYTQS